MQKTCTLLTMALGTMLTANLFAQQTSSASTQTPSSSTTHKSSTAKTTTTHKATTTAAPPLTTDKQKFSYALGMNLGGNLHHQSVEIDPTTFMRGLKDAMAGRKTQLTDEEAHTVLSQMQDKMRAVQMQKMQQESAANKKKGEDFLAANKSKPGVVTLPSGLQYKIIKEGTGPKPTAKDTVVCNYKGTLIDGKEFDSSYKRGQPVTFPVSGVIKGWTEALQLMPVGSTWELYIPSDLAYGDRGAGQDIQPGDALVFQVELLSIQNPGEKTPQQ